MVVEDRFTIGFIAGVIGGVVMSILDYISYGLGIVGLLYIDWASVFILGHRFENVGEALVGQWGHLLFSGLAGIVFAYLVIGVSSRYLYFKAIVYAYLIWFFTYAAILLFDITALKAININTALSNMVTVGIYGLVLAYVHKRLYFSAVRDPGDHS